MRPCDVCDGLLEPFRHEWLWRCDDCRALHATFPVAIPDSAGAATLDEAMRESGLEALRAKNNGRLLAALAGLTAPGGRFLDVGSGPGFLLGHAKAMGFAPQGIEPDANTVAAARSRGAAVRHGFFPDVLEPGERFDVIVFNDVLEHIPDLRAALQACAVHVETGGVLCLNCPDRRGFFFRTADILDRLGLHGPYDRLWQRGLPSPHVWYFTTANLARAAANHGFAPAGEVRLETVELAGLWRRIRYVKDQPLSLSLAAYVFALVTYPLARLFPADATACFFRKA
ncbi:MAG TPA: class I SAM-dependent methyltransferase [Caulobacteraceae bacterium]|nr:class I SAM-dependent methyltransferase [Caulobacteraceae bacterium]